MRWTRAAPGPAHALDPWGRTTACTNRWLYDRRDVAEARTDLAADGKGQAKYPRLVAWVEENIEETLTLYPLSRQQP